MARLAVSMADVAKHAGVSPQTVSRVSTGYPGVREPTRRRVLASMEALRYRPNSAARALKRGSFQSIAVVLSGLASTGNSRTLQGIVESAAPQGYTVTVLTVGALSDETLQGAFTRLAEAAVDGAILVMEIEAAAELHLSALSSDRLVIVDSNAADEYPVVDTDQASGTRAAVEHLLDLGHATVHHVMGPADSYAARRRAEAWRAVLTERGCPVPEALPGDWNAASGYAAGLRLADDGVATAVFCSNDEMALGVLRAFGERGIRVPEDVSLVGFDDIPAAAQFSPPLTTVHQDFDEVGRRCVDLVVAQIESGEVSAGIDLVPTHLVVRASTAPPSPR